MENLLQAVADKLTSLGWRATGDAQWTNLEKAIPELVALLRPPSPTVGGGGELLRYIVNENGQILKHQGTEGGLYFADAVDTLLASPLVRADAAPAWPGEVVEAMRYADGWLILRDYHPAKPRMKALIDFLRSTPSAPPAAWKGMEGWRAHGRKLMAAHRAQLPSEAADLYGGGCGCPQCEEVRALLSGSNTEGF